MREILAGSASLDHAKIESLLELLEQALDQSDLQPLYRQLRAEAKSRKRR